VTSTTRQFLRERSVKNYSSETFVYGDPRRRFGDTHSFTETFYRELYGVSCERERIEEEEDLPARRRDISEKA